jgi:phytoene synthase
LILLHFPRAAQSAVAALWAIDEAMGAAIAGASQPALAGIKLAWWREALARLDTDPPPHEPRLRAVADTLLPLGISGHDVAAIEQGWAALIQERQDPEVVARRGHSLFAIEARLVGSTIDLPDAAGALFALTDAMRRGIADCSAARDAALASLRRYCTPVRLRPVTLAARLAARDPAEPEGTPGRALALLAHRLTGKINAA